MSTIWRLAPRVHEDVLQQVLHQRGIAPDAVEHFFSPLWERDVHGWEAFTRAHEAAQRVLQALRAGEQMVIHGDYDADGVCGSTLLWSALHEAATALGVALNARVFLPDRERDGYGVALHTVERLAAEGTKLLITVDCGIANADELSRAHELGVDVIVCDHHQLGAAIPAHAILLHPLVPGETYPNKVLCGTGVAFKLACALFAAVRASGATIPEGREKWLLDLVAIATVTDVMPLVGENRALEHFGLKVLAKTRRPGLRALCASSGTELATIDPEAIGFRLGPRLNAAGRLASADLAFAALAAEDDANAALAAGRLEELNRQRQQVFASSYAEAWVQADAARSGACVLAVYASHWLPGIVGLIAGKLAQEFGMPAFAFAHAGERIVGSGRSSGGLHLVEAMQACDAELFLRRGGHPQACGLTLRSEEDISAFRAQMNAAGRIFFGEDGPRDELQLDATLTLAQVTPELVDALAQCAPFGEGNRPPVFLLPQLEVTKVTPRGARGDHLEVQVRNADGRRARAIGFGLADTLAWMREGVMVDLAVTLVQDVWQGERRVQLRLRDARLCSTTS